MKLMYLAILVFLLTLSLAQGLSNEKILVLTHSTGAGVYGGGVASWFTNYNNAQGTSLAISRLDYPTNGYPWNNYPYDYWNLWIHGACQPGNPNMECLDTLAQNYDVITWKHCFPGSGIGADTGNPNIASATKTSENYKLQYEALLAEMDKYPNTMFIVWTLPPLHRLASNPLSAARATEFSRWMREDWLAEDGQAHPNVYVWDFRDIVMGHDPAAIDYNFLAYNYESSDSHPNPLANSIAAPLFSQFIIDSMAEFFDGQIAQTYCGDGAIQTPNDNAQQEECDSGNQNGVVCTPSYGTSCTYCSNTCQTTTVAPTQYCGNTLIEGAEICDGTNVGSQTCQVVGSFIGGTLSCQEDCAAYDTSACVTSTIHLSECGILDQADAYYILDNDVIADNSCFLINNNDITLDLNGHTISYAASPSTYYEGDFALGCSTYAGRQWGTLCHHAISNRQGYTTNNDPGGTPDWYSVPKISCARARILNGSILQANNLSSYSQGIVLSCDGAVIHDVTIRVSGSDSMNMVVSGTGIEVYNNELYSTVTHVSNRHAIFGQLEAGVSRSLIHDNIIIGSPQRGIDGSGASHSQYYNNYISQNASYTNNHAIGFYGGTNVSVYNNTIQPTDGRGVSCEFVNGCYIYDNFINVTETPHAEYSGAYGMTCAHGIKLEGSITDAQIYGNTVISYSKATTWGGCPLNLGIDGETSGEVLIYDNNFIAQRKMGSEASAWATGVIFYGGYEHTKIYHNNFSSNHYMLYGDGALPGPTFYQNNFIRTTPESDIPFQFYHIYAYNSSTNSTLLISNTFTDGSFEDVHIQNLWANYWDYSTMWNLKIFVYNNYAPVAGGEISIRNANNELIYSGTSTESGYVELNATEFTMAGHSNNFQEKTTYSPYSVTVSFDGRSSTKQIQLTDDSEENFNFGFGEIPTDFNNDGTTTLADFLILQDNYQVENCVCDLSGDGVTNILDLLLFGRNFFS